MKRIVWLLSSLLAGTSAHADQCTDVFTHGAASFSSSGEIIFESGAQVIGSDGTLDFSNIDDSSGGVSCETQACNISGSTAGSLTLESFRNTTSNDSRKAGGRDNLILAAGEYKDIEIETRGAVTFSDVGGTYLLETLTLDDSTQANFAPGDYWIKDLSVGDRSALTVTSNGTVRIYVESAEFKERSEVNDRGNPANLVLISYDDVTLGERAEFTGFVYALDDLTLDKNSRVIGAVSAEKVELKEDSTVQFVETDIGTAEFGAVCDAEPENTEPELVAHWPFDVCSLSGDAGDVVDIIGGFDGQSIEGANIDVDGQYCQAGDFAGSGAHINIPHNNAFALDEGTISFWFNAPNLSHSNDRRRGGMGLFSKDSTGTDNGGDHLTIWLDSDGGLFVRHQDTSSSFEIDTSSGIVTANTWHHLVYTFGPTGMTLYLDAQEVGSDNHTGGLSGNPEPIILASNAWQTDNNVSPPSQLGDHFRGQMDDVRLYDKAMDLTEVQALNAIAEGSCDACVFEDELEAYWPIDICSVDGSNDEIVDIINGYNGATVDGADIDETGKFCQAGDFNGSGAHINIPAQTAFEASEGAISLWFRTPDLSHSNSSRHGGQGLFSRDSTGFDGGGHLTIWLQADGSLNVRHQDSSNSYEITTATSIAAQDTWHHMVYTWGRSGMLIYLDNVQVGSNSNFTGGLNGNQEPIVLAANARQSDDNEADPNDLGDFFIGQMDDVRFYSNQINTTTIDELFNQAEGTCGSCESVDLQAHYQFEESEWNNAGDVLDVSTFLRHGSPLGGVSPLAVVDGVSCQVLDVPSNTSQGVIDAVDTGIDMNTVGNQGTISFWYRSNLDWTSNVSRQLFDASNDGLSSDKHFYLALDAGELEFGIEDSDDRGVFVRLEDLTFAADEWVHIAVTWDLSGEELRLFVSNDTTSLSATGSRSGLNNTLGDMLSLFIGDNRGTYFVEESTGNSADGQFDDFRIYNIVQSAQEISDDKDDVNTCALVDHYDVTFTSPGLTCEASTFSVRACADAMCTELYDQPSTIDLSGIGEVSIPAGEAGSGEVSQATPGDFAFSLVSSNPETINNPALTCNGGNDCNLNFEEAVLQIFGSAVGVLPEDQIAEAAFTSVQIRAIRDSNGVCEAALSGPQDLTLTHTCGDSAANCPTSLVYGANALSQSDTVNVTFSDQGIAVLSDGSGSAVDLSYADVAELNLGGSVMAGGALLTTEDTTGINVYPAELRLALDNGGEFVAGDDFSLTLGAYGAAGSVLPSYQPQALEINAYRPVENDNVQGTLTYGGSATKTSTRNAGFTGAEALNFANGEYTFASSQYDEEGGLNLSFQDTVFGNLVSSNQASADFRPAYLLLSNQRTPEFAPFCSTSNAFSYIGQTQLFDINPEVTVTAYNRQGDVAANYRDTDWSWLQDSAQLGRVSYTSPVVGQGIIVDQQGSIVLDTSTNGAALTTLVNAQLRYDRDDAVPVAPLSGPQMTLATDFFEQGNLCAVDENDRDGDCIGLAFGTIGGVDEHRYGRLALQNSSGPENVTMRVGVIAEYFDGSGFIPNGDDSCTVLNFGQVDFALTHVGDGTDITGSLGGSVSADFTLANGRNGPLDGIIVPFAPDPSDPTQGIGGQFLLELLPIVESNVDWRHLSFEWNNPNGNNLPLSVIVFGQYRGNDRIINWREVVGD